MLKRCTVEREEIQLHRIGRLSFDRQLGIEKVFAALLVGGSDMQFATNRQQARFHDQLEGEEER